MLPTVRGVSRSTVRAFGGRFAIALVLAVVVTSASVVIVNHEINSRLQTIKRIHLLVAQPPPAGENFLIIGSDSRQFVDNPFDANAFGTESATAFIEGLTKNGGRATGRSMVPAKSGADWAKVVAAIRGQPTKSVFAAFVTDDAEGLLGAWDAAGMRTAGYRLVGPGPLADAQVLSATKQAGVGVTTAFPWSSELDNPENKTFVEEFKKAYKDDTTGQPLVPDGYAVEMWNTMRVLEDALKTTKGDTKNTDALIAALEGVSFKGASGDFAFDRSTHNPIQDVLIREVRTSGGALVHAVVDKIGSVKDPGQ